VIGRPPLATGPNLDHGRLFTTGKGDDVRILAGMLAMALVPVVARTETARWTVLEVLGTSATPVGGVRYPD